MTTDPIDMDQLKGLADAAGIDTVNVIMDAFWQSADDLLIQLRETVNSGDWEAALAAAHALKGAAANVGAAHLADVAKDLETAARSGDQAGTQAALQAVPGSMAATRDAVSQLLSQLAA